MVLEGIIALLLLVIAGMTWVWYLRPKMHPKADTTVEALKESFDTEYHEIIESIANDTPSYDSAKVLLENLKRSKEAYEALDTKYKDEQKFCLNLQDTLTKKSREIIHISHQMRTSLSGLLGFTHFLKESNLDEEQHELLDVIETSSNELLILVNGIIDMTPKPLDETVEAKKEVLKDSTLKSAAKNKIPRLLVVDDNDINKRLLAKVLENENLDVSYASNGQEAVDLRKAENFDIIFMDIQMPVMDGVEASKEIRSYENNESLMPVSIVALTANTGKNDRESYLAAGMNDYMAKPIMIDDVRQRISALQ